MQKLFEIRIFLYAMPLQEPLEDLLHIIFFIFSWCNLAHFSIKNSGDVIDVIS